MMPVTISYVGLRRSVLLHLCQEDFVDTVKGLACDRFGIVPDAHLLFNASGHLMPNHLTMRECGVRPRAVLHLLVGTVEEEEPAAPEQTSQNQQPTDEHVAPPAEQTTRSQVGPATFLFAFCFTPGAFTRVGKFALRFVTIIS